MLSKLRLISIKQLTVPCSVFRGKENSILWKKDNKTIWTDKIDKMEQQKMCTQFAILPIL